MTPDQGLASWLQLTLTPGLGASAILELLRQFGPPENVLAVKRAQLQRYAPAAALDAMHSDRVARAVQAALAWLEAPGNAAVTLGDASYPKLLLEIPDPPLLLYCRGQLALLNRPTLAVVGSRNATAQGIRNAEQFARAFSEAGLTIVSGLAQGIDAAAHRGGLGAAGSTIAVLGTGADVIYPPSNAALAAEIVNRGLLISEFALGTPPAAHNFPRRNRLISGLAQGCVVVEAAASSGSLITARTAAEQGREVFALPGSIHSPLSKGCHALIKSGAKLAESADDVLTELGSIQRNSFASTRSSVEVPESAQLADEPLLAHMGDEPVDVDSLCVRARLPASRIAAELLRLELAGQVAALPGGLYQRLH